jgi:hypothetical protein
VLIRFGTDRSRLTGSIQVQDGPARAFCGRLELMRELEQFHEPDHEPARPEPEDSP